MSIPLDTLVDKDVNVYEKTCVAIKEAAIMAADKEAEAALDEKHEKVVSAVLTKVLNDEVEYTPVEK